MSVDLNLDIHNTSASDSPDTDVSPFLARPLPDSPPAARSEAKTLLELSSRLDSDVSRHMTVLTSNQVTMTTPLIDAQGFPLANKDLMAIRTAKQRINVLRNDSRALRDRVAKLLELAINGDAVQSTSTSAVSHSGTTPQLKAFAKVNSVAENSPAQTAGLSPGDEIVKFGSITAEKGLTALAAPGVVVDGTSIQIQVRRSGDAISLTLTPRAGWGGRGLLGCHLLPL
ncbi:putative 26S proteasome regulatory subunit p27 [Pseudozyma hubeiensis]|nr:putative 26S proteasome regulatory subunit p27 [Pseudozyma hubeiensis]